jgi:hypothetical protein
MPLRVSIIERCEPTPEIKRGFKHFSGTVAQPEFRKAPGGSLPYSFVLLESGCTPAGPVNRVPLDKWVVAVGPNIRRAPGHPDSFEHAPGFCVWEDQPGLPDAATLRPLFYRFVHTRLAKRDKTQGTISTQAVAAQIFVPSNPDAAPPAE